MTDHTVFHCGLQKTGSTYLQQHVFPQIRGGRYVGTSTFRRTLEVLAGDEGPRLVSDENLSGRPASGRYRDQRREMLATLATHWPGAGLILFLREPASIVRSFYSQDILQGGTLAFDDWLDRTNVADALRFDELIDDLASMAWGDVILFDHAQLRDEPGAVVAMMERFVGCTFEGWSLPTGVRTNSGVDRAAGRLLRSTNRVLDSPRNPKGRVARTATRAMRGAHIEPRTLVRRPPFRSLNGRGAPLVPEGALTEIGHRNQNSWRRAAAEIRRSQVPWLTAQRD